MQVAFLSAPSRLNLTVASHVSTKHVLLRAEKVLYRTESCSLQELPTAPSFSLRHKRKLPRIERIYAKRIQALRTPLPPSLSRSRASAWQRRRGHVPRSARSGTERTT